MGVSVTVSDESPNPGDEVTVTVVSMYAPGGVQAEVLQALIGSTWRNWNSSLAYSNDWTTYWSDVTGNGGTIVFDINYRTEDFFITYRIVYWAEGQITGYSDPTTITVSPNNKQNVLPEMPYRGLISVGAEEDGTWKPGHSYTVKYYYTYASGYRNWADSEFEGDIVFDLIEAGEVDNFFPASWQTENEDEYFWKYWEDGRYHYATEEYVAGVIDSISFVSEEEVYDNGEGSGDKWNDDECYIYTVTVNINGNAPVVKARLYWMLWNGFRG